MATSRAVTTPLFETRRSTFFFRRFVPRSSVYVLGQRTLNLASQSGRPRDSQHGLAPPPGTQDPPIRTSVGLTMPELDPCAACSMHEGHHCPLRCRNHCTAGGRASGRARPNGRAGWRRDELAGGRARWRAARGRCTITRGVFFFARVRPSHDQHRNAATPKCAQRRGSPTRTTNTVTTRLAKTPNAT